jgi:excisionase family DNA binding protein
MKRSKADAATPLWSIQEAATFLGVPVATLYRWRHRGTGPKAYRARRHLRYDPARARQWLESEAA